jgi:4-amino-4-deoxy-L-arabinose transferase-like glycosyltransferase
MTYRHQLVYLLIVLLLAACVRLLLVNYETEIGVDSVHYILEGNNIAHGTSIDTWNTTGGRWIVPPTLPFVVAIFRLLGFGLEWSGHLASLFAGVLLLIPVYLLAKRLYGQGPALISAWITAFTPILVDYSVIVATELIFAGCVIVMMIFTHRAISSKGSIWDSLWSGIWLGLSFLTRTLGIMLLPWLLISYMFSKSGHSKSRPAIHATLALLGFLILAVPYWIALKENTGRWVIDGRFGTYGSQILYSNNIDQEAVFERYTGELTPDHSDFLINTPSSVMKPPIMAPSETVLNIGKKYIQKLIRIYLDFPFTPTFPNGVQLFYLFPVFLLGLGIFTGPGKWSDRDSDRFMLFWLFPFVFILPLAFIEVRYFIPVIAILVPFMAVGADRIGSWITSAFPNSPWLNKNSSRAITIVILAFVLLATPKITYKITHWDDPMISYNPRHVAADWLKSWCKKENIDITKSRIMEYGHSVSFYSGAQSILIPDGDLADLIAIARKYNVEFLSLDEFQLIREHRRPAIEFLFDTSLPPPNQLERLYIDEKYPGLHHVLYRFRPDPQISSLPGQGFDKPLQ